MLLVFQTKKKATDVGRHFAFVLFLQYVRKVALVIANKLCQRNPQTTIKPCACAEDKDLTLQVCTRR